MKNIFSIISLVLILSCILFAGCAPHQHVENYDNYCKTCDYDFAKTLVLQNDGSFVAEEQSLTQNKNYAFNLVGNGEGGWKFSFISLYGEVTFYQIKIVGDDKTEVNLPLMAMDPFSELEFDGQFKQGVKYRITVGVKTSGRGYLSVLPID